MPTITELRVNGNTHSLNADADRTLLEVLREDLDLTGAKYGCGAGDCSACTVLVNGVATRSCLTSVGDVAGKEITTIEGLAKNGALHPVQEAFLKEDAFQCGYCIPGMIMGLAGLLAKRPVPSDQEILSRMERHLCRCCGYPSLVKAIRRAAAQARS
ncbi:MAG: (2Fe-2S)-binding protein [Verrucomicrobia bacterium]|nr:(2Fe-2S)-binding protein [Verrucomicrobiota bacterium]